MKYYVLILLAVLLVSCDGKLHFSDCNIEIRIDYGDLYFTHNDKAVSGDLWSDDGKTMRAVLENGAIKKIELYHPNGKLAHLMVGAEQSEFYYDETGKKITPLAYEKKYERFDKAWDDVMHYEIRPHIKNLQESGYNF